MFHFSVTFPWALFQIALQKVLLIKWLVMPINFNLPDIQVLRLFQLSFRFKLGRWHGNARLMIYELTFDFIWFHKFLLSLSCGNMELLSCLFSLRFQKLSSRCVFLLRCGQLFSYFLRNFHNQVSIFINSISIFVKVMFNTGSTL